jgi:predicted dehydrogenase
MAALRAGIIGGGWIARRHVPAIDAAQGVELVAACDADLARAEAIAQAHGARAYERWEEMLDGETLDLLWVCTPPLAHRVPTAAALARGIHVYLEKPLARTLEDGEAIVAAAEAADPICVVGYQWHATELLDDIRAAVGPQSIGMLTGRNYGPVADRPWFMDRSQGGGQILERGSHHIDLQRAIAGDIRTVQAIGGAARLSGADEGRTDIDDVVALVFHFASGALGSVSIAWSAPGQPELYGLDVIAGDASLWVQLGPDTFALQGVAAGLGLRAAYGDPFDRSVARFLEVVRSGERDRVFCTPRDALQTLRVALACERALTTGAPVVV